MWAVDIISIRVSCSVSRWGEKCIYNEMCEDFARGVKLREGIVEQLNGRKVVS